ncbi:MAG: branched-chain amino acid ABC transporter permease [Desulfobacula sp.]|nr:branched-chain amino acid ABC transporter permease [Desulfobacula sp.]
MNTKSMVTILAVTYGFLGILPLFLGDSSIYMRILTMILIWSVVASCWDLIMGYAGIFSFGQVAFYVIGAYSSAILSVSLNVPPIVSIFMAGLITAIIGVIIGLPCLKLAGPYIALVTFAFQLALEPFLKGPLGKAIGSGGSRGIISVPPIHLFGVDFSSSELVPYFYLTFVLTLICSAVIVVILKSHWGTAFLALKDSEDFAASLGVSAFKYKLLVFAITSFITGLFGALYVHYVGILSTRMLSMEVFTVLLIMIVVGGIGQYPGVVLGAVVTVTMNELLRPMGIYRLLIMGGMVVVIVLLLPDGVTGLIRKFSFSRWTNKESRSIETHESNL